MHAKIHIKTRRKSKRPPQISETLRDFKVGFHDIEFAGDQLSRGILLTGQTGSGKTLSMLNPLAAAILNKKTRREQKAGGLYLNVKGNGHLDLLDKLDKSRRADVREVGSDGDFRLLLFPDQPYRRTRQAALEAAAFIPEFARRRVGTSCRDGNHKAFFENNFQSFLKNAALLWACAREMIVPPPFACDSALFGVIETAQALCDYMMVHKSISRGEAPSLKVVAPSGFYELERSMYENEKIRQDLQEMLGDIATFLRMSYEQKNIQALDHSIAAINGVKRLLSDPLVEGKSYVSSSPVISDAFHPEEWLQLVINELPPEDFRILERTSGMLARSTKNNSYFDTIVAELSGIAQGLQSPRIEKYFARDSGPNTVTISQIIDEGLIVLVDAQVSTMEGRDVALSTLQHFCETFLNRLDLQRNDGTPVNRVRPVVLCADEFPMYATSGRNSGLEKFLSQARENGCISILATQSLGLVMQMFENPAAYDGFMANVCTRIFGASASMETNHHASALCGIGLRTSHQRAGLVFCPNPALEALQNERAETFQPLIEPRTFAALHPGQFLVRLSDGTVGKWEVRWDNPNKGFSLIGRAATE